MRTALPAILVLLVVALLFAFLPGLKDRPWTGLRIIGAVTVGVGFVLVIIARIQLGDSFSVKPEAKTLVTHGLYARFSSPMYLFLDLALAGLILSVEIYWLYAILAVLATVQIIQARRESKVLQEKFGNDYLNYRAQTWF
jgi:protein-S-isoprenylcysteine O-methyltransferase Ste14